MDHFLSFFTARMHWHLSVYLHGPQHSREMGVSLMNYLPSTAARHQSAITISATSTSGWEIRKWGTQRFVICPRSGSSQRNWGTECDWPEAAQQLHPQWSSTGVLVPVTLVKAAPDGCNSLFSAAKFFYGKLLEYFFSWDGYAVLCLLTKPFPSRLCELAHICWAPVPTHPCCSAPHN